MTPKFYMLLLRFATSSLYRYVDKNKDGKIDKKELQLILNVLKNLQEKVLKRDKKQEKVIPKSKNGIKNTRKSEKTNRKV